MPDRLTALDASFLYLERPAMHMHVAGLSILENQRRRGATTHPFFWGGFVAAGDWR